MSLFGSVNYINNTFNCMTGDFNIFMFYKNPNKKTLYITVYKLTRSGPNLVITYCNYFNVCCKADIP